LLKAFMKRPVFLIPFTVIATSLLGMILPFIAPLFDEWSLRLAWLLDLAAHWQWLYALALFIGIIFGATLNRRILLLLPFMALPSLTAAPQLHTGSWGGQLTLVSANVELNSHDPSALMRWVRDQEADIVVILEVSPQFSAKLQQTREFPHQLSRPDTGPFGIAVLSKYPIADWSAQKPSGGTQRIDTVIEFKGRKIAMSAYHPKPPLNPRLHQIRNEELQGLTTSIIQKGSPGLVVGDFNATPWSTAFSGLSAKGWRRASNLTPTWPTVGHGLIGIPIDHVLATDEWQLVRYEVGPDIGSDHYPIVAQLVLRSEQR
jgi:endonuclease/exonuclease/phosphatase (EEP) superfamily protein YafD